jgi:hypothetical protein
MVDRYTKTVLTIIALSLVWIAARESIPGAIAQKQRFGQEVLLAGITTTAAKCLAGHLSFLGKSEENQGQCVAMG